MLKGSSNQEDAVFDVKSARCARWRPVRCRQHSGYIADGRQQCYGSRWKRMEDMDIGQYGLRIDVGAEVVHLRATRSHVSCLAGIRTAASHSRHG